jgi:hypothetical protein
MINKLFFILLFLIFTVGCGVKGDPKPPLMPAEIGRGQPSYRRVLKNVSLPQSQEEDEEDANEEK